MSLYTLPRFKGLMIFSLLILGAASYVYTYTLMLEGFDRRSALPFIESAEFLNMAGTGAGVLTAHPDLLARYYGGPIYKIPEKGGFEDILQEAKEKGARYLIIESTCINSREQMSLYYHSVNTSWARVPPEFELIKAEPRRYGLYLIGPEEKQQLSFKAAIFGHLESRANVKWEEMLALMGASTSTFDDGTMLSSVNVSEFDVMVFADFRRPIDNAERLYLEESIKNGSIIIVSGISPYYLAGGTEDLMAISSWFGATVFSEAPREARWKVKFTENANQITRDLDLNREYAFYRDSDWSTPTGCLVQPESILYAYRVNDQAATIFSHRFGEGIIIFSGPRYGFMSQDTYEFIAFLRALILSALVQASSH